jgi:hypothetical protein
MAGFEVTLHGRFWVTPEGYNNRGGKKKEEEVTDLDRFELALSLIANKRLTYTEVTGKDSATPF